MPRWMINCEEHSRLASRDMDGPLSFWDHISARIHRRVCPPCRQFKKQLDAIRSACRDGLAAFDKGRDAADDAAILPEDVCRKMKTAIRKRLNG